MYGIEEIELPRLHREEIRREVRLNRMAGVRRAASDTGVMWELKRDFGRLLRLFQAVKNAG